jgi:hypothetical protein
MVRQDRDRGLRKEWWFLERLKVSREWQEGWNKMQEEFRRDRERDDERWQKWEEESRWWDAYFDGNIKKIGYRYLPAYCLQRPIGIWIEEYDSFMKGEGVKYGRLLISLSSLATYLSVSIVLSIKLVVWSWEYLNHKVLGKIRGEIENWLE